MTISLQELRDQIESGTREMTVMHNSKSDGSGSLVASQMVYIPKFRIPAGLWEGGAFPTRDLKLGGFLIDKYQCSQPDATALTRGGTSANTPGLVAATSQQGVVPWTGIDWNNAKVACENRVINGRACHLVTMKEWATMCFLIKLLRGDDIRGNNDWGKDYRDADNWENYGIMDPVRPGYSGHEISRVLTGSGPVTWAHNGMANGVFDIVGNVWEWVDFLIDCGVHQTKKAAQIRDTNGITADDTAIVIDNVENPSLWPVSNGLILIKAEDINTDEYVVYTSFVDNGDGTYTLTGCQRGQNGTAASAHNDDADIEQLTDYCIIPGGWAAKVANAGLNNTDDPATFDIEKLVLGPGNNNPQVGDILQCETEQLQVTDVSGSTITASRGANGSTAAAHAQGVGIACLSPQMGNSNPDATGDYGAYQSERFETMRAEQELEAYALPFTASSGGSEEWYDRFYIRNYDVRAAVRGGYWSYGSHARFGFALILNFLPSYLSSSRGFRAALSL